MAHFNIIGRLLLLGMTLLLSALSTNVFGQNPNFHIYLAFGQSNMEGQGPIEEEDRNVPSNVKVLWSSTASDVADEIRNTGKWYTAVPPLSHRYGKLGVAEYFGRKLSEELGKSITIGIINVSVAGASISLFDKDTYADYINNMGSATWLTQRIDAYGGNPYGRLIEMAKLAQKEGVIKGIIMHQGETDRNDGEWPSKVKKVYNDIINDLNLGNDIPLLAGEALRTGVGRTANTNIAKLPKQNSNFYVVSSEGFNQALSDGQNLHFTSAEYRSFGIRYAEKMIEVLGDKIRTVAGDVNNDGSVTMADANMIVNYFLATDKNSISGFNKEAGDVNNDGDISMADANAIVNLFLGTGN